VRCAAGLCKAPFYVGNSLRHAGAKVFQIKKSCIAVMQNNISPEKTHIGTGSAIQSLYFTVLLFLLGTVYEPRRFYS
jgi:hypothetical protein